MKTECGPKLNGIGECPRLFGVGVDRIPMPDDADPRYPDGYTEVTVWLRVFGRLYQWRRAVTP